MHFLCCKRENVITNSYKMLGTNLKQTEHIQYHGMELFAGLVAWFRSILWETFQDLIFSNKYVEISITSPETTLFFFHSTNNAVCKHLQGIKIALVEFIQMKMVEHIANDFRNTTSTTALQDKFKFHTLQNRDSMAMYKIHYVICS